MRHLHINLFFNILHRSNCPVVSLRFLIALLLISLTFGFAGGKGPTYHKATAKDGDGAYSLLRRYQLIDHRTNLDKFFELNALKHGSHLVKGNNYLLPVLIYQYDGQSIRSTIGIDDWDLASRIADYNSDLLQDGLRQDSYQSSGLLWVPMHEMTGNHANAEVAKAVAVEEDAPEEIEEPVGATPVSIKAVPAENVNAAPTAGKLIIPLFGEEHKEVLHKSNDLKGHVFYLVSGHGGPDPGAISQYTGEQLCEDEYAYDVTLRLAKRLMEQGAIVEVIIQDPDDGIRSESILDCDKEEICMGRPIPLWQKTRLEQRTYAINTLHKQYRAKGIDKHTVVCIHVDSRSPQRRQDVFFYYYDESRSGRDLAIKMQNVFREKYKKNRPGRDYKGTVSSRSLYVLKFTDPTAVYVELANIKNAHDRHRILPESNRQALANWLYEGLTR